jgi:hypothetical protein
LKLFHNSKITYYEKFILCLFSKSLGSTGFTTVEELEDSTPELSQVNCFDHAWHVYDAYLQHTGSETVAFSEMNQAYENCMDHEVGCGGSADCS